MDRENLITEENAIQKTESWLKQKVFGSVEEEIYQRGSFTVCIIHASADKREFEGVGFSKARQEIKIAQYDSERGKSVARGRAVHDLFINYKKYTHEKK